MPGNLGNKLDFIDQITKELREIIKPLVEAREWFAKEGKVTETASCDRVMQAIVKAIFLADRVYTCTHQQLNSSNNSNSFALPDLFVR